MVKRLDESGVDESRTQKVFQPRRIPGPPEGLEFLPFRKSEIMVGGADLCARLSQNAGLRRETRSKQVLGRF
jgi:hypothetical protein